MTFLRKPSRMWLSSVQNKGCSSLQQVAEPAERRQATGFVQKDQETPGFERDGKLYPTQLPLIPVVFLPRVQRGGCWAAM